MENSYNHIPINEIIEQWNRNKYPKFTDYLDSKEFKEFLESYDE